MSFAMSPRSSPPRTARRFSGRKNVDEVIGAFVRLRFQWDATKLIILHDGTTVRVTDPEDDLQPELTYRFSGKWFQHPKYGKQFYADSFAVDAPITRAGVTVYLSEFVRGMGPAKATKMFELFGAQAIDVLRDSPEKVAAAGILSIEDAREGASVLRIASTNQRVTAELFGLFKGRGLGRRAIQDCINLWGVGAADVVRRDPFKMLVNDVKGAGFKRCDDLYLDLGLPPRRLKRLMLCAWAELHKDMDGHTWFPEQKALGKGATPKALDLGVRTGWLTRRVIDGKAWITERSKAQDERTLARELARLVSWRPPLGDQGYLRWPSVDELAGASGHQTDVLRNTLVAPVVLLCGAPGVGKTFCAGLVINWILQTYGPGIVKACAPTGRAANRLRATLSQIGITSVEPMTIHRMLRATPDLDAFPGESVQSVSGFLIVDEASMLDTRLAAFLTSRIATGTHVLIIGDPYQLPPVGHGAPLRDLIRSKAIPVGEFTEIRRNAGRIVEACHAIKSGKRFETSAKYVPGTGENLRHFDAVDPEDAVTGISNILPILSGLGFHPKRDVQILVAMNNSSPCSRKPINAYLQDVLNRDGKRAEGNPFRIEDKVICLRNAKLKLVKYVPEILGRDKDPRAAESYQETGGEDYVANGEIGKVLAISSVLTIAEFPDPTRVVKIIHPRKSNANASKANPGQDAEDDSQEFHFDLAYAVTVHKAQGSEWPCVIVVIDPAARLVCSREHVYTAVSRARQLCVMIGSRSVLDNYVAHPALTKRKTFLAEEFANLGLGVEESEDGTTSKRMGASETGSVAEATRVEV